MIPKNTLTLAIDLPDDATPVQGVWRIYLETVHGVAINDAGDGLAGSRLVPTDADTGIAAIDLPDTTDADYVPQGAYYRANFTSIDRRVRIMSEPFQMDTDKRLEDILTPTDLPITPSLVSRAEIAAEAAEAALAGMGDLTSAVTSVNTQTGVVVLSAADVGADPAGSASTAQAAAITAAATDATTKANAAASGAATALASHEADTTAVHGIANTALLETTSGAQSKADAAQAAAIAAIPEAARDTLAAALVAGANITITPNDGSDTITIAATGGGGGNVMVVENDDGTVTITVDPDGPFTLVDNGDGTADLTLDGDTATIGGVGRGISSIARTSGTGAAGTTDTYTVTFTDATTTTFTVVNGANGGAGANGAIAQIQDEGSNLAVRSTVNFTGAGVTASDSGGVTVVNIPGGGGGTGDLLSTNNLSDLANAGTARTNLGLGTAAVKNTGTTSGDIPLLSTGGVLPIARLATGTPDGTKFVRDDGTLATPAGGGSVTASSNFITADVTMTTNGTYYDGGTLSLAAGTYVVSGAVQLLAGSTAARTWQAKIWDGTTAYANGVFVVTGTAGVGQTTISLPGVLVTLASTTAVKMSATSSVNGDTLRGLSTKGTYLTALKIA